MKSTDIGKYNNLQIVKELDFGVYLDGGELGEILLPKRYVPNDVKIDDFIDVFVYNDSEDRVIATTEKPFATVGEFALLKVVSVNSYGAFLDWGLIKDLLLPYSEQKQKMDEGQSCIVFVYLDFKSKRIAASSKIEKYLDNIPADYKEGEEVELLICNPTDIGYTVIINKLHQGMLYKNEIFTTVHRGQKIKGYIKKNRDDEKIDVCLYKQGYGKVDSVAKEILQQLLDQGILYVTDKSSPDEIYKRFKVSKKSFKQAIGFLYKQKLISLETDGIRLIEND